MALFNNINSSGLHNNQQPNKTQEQINPVIDQAIKADPESYTKPSNPVKEQIKEKLDTN